MRKPQCFCFPCAGGAATFFQGIEKDLPDAELVKMEYAGHGTRRKEPFYRDFGELAEDMVSRLRSAYTGGTYALFGYSMGSIALAEVLKRILADPGFPVPCCAFLGAHAPGPKAELEGFRPDELDEWVRERTIRFGAIPERIQRNASFWRMYLPLYRADYTIIGKYEFDKLDLRTDVPAAVFYSETDTPRREMEAWRKYFTGECGYYAYPGSHFFILEHHAEMAEIIREKMGL